MSSERIPKDKRRLTVFGRVNPETLEFLNAIGERNHGRAIDRLVNTLVEIRARVCSLPARLGPYPSSAVNSGDGDQDSA